MRNMPNLEMRLLFVPARSIEQHNSAISVEELNIIRAMQGSCPIASWTGEKKVTLVLDRHYMVFYVIFQQG